VGRAISSGAIRGPWETDLSRLPGPLGKLGQKELHLWVGAWLRDRARKATIRRRKGTRHLLFAICDHYEPLHGGADYATGRARVDAWRTRYPEIARVFRDADGRPPRHSYFFPGEQYDGRLLEPLAEMCALGMGEVEVHLHHDGDTRETLRASLEKTLADLDRHGVVAKTRVGAKPAWAFIHGNWCLANARRDGRWCGVDDEMALLWELGCYADLTFPSAPDESQPGIVNSIYYPRGDVGRRRAYEDGAPVRVGTPRQDRLLLIEGPIALARRRGPSASAGGIRIESSALDRSDPPTAARLATWVAQDVTVGGRPEWVFVKLHTHGAPEKNAEVLLGDTMMRFHEELGRRHNDGENWKLHYVTAREMFNLARAAMDGKRGEPREWLDYEIPPPERARGHAQKGS
jgi:hypothetical protein